ncbi:MAG: UDP-N-acetylglucosamine 2-epimerase (non-hydrolyzing) [Ignavibacteriae bacterium HGW-Ignavibacteriae-1]|jgi:UDP-N-acetylglucosamine 2-epimerase (non-hydrolysing)|nr:MAG: UDP-N-acetylglucosamine 2-epimerase (non-hydrolyzing) [Ignavibacteriae bacterium HGW-Ignavibacteriae-1]
MSKIINIVGARPNFMKIAPLMKAYSGSTSLEPILLHTGQHYDAKMSSLFFDELGIPKPDINLEVGSDTQAKQVAKIMERFEDVCFSVKPDAILVVGDVNSTMACSIVAAKLGIKIVHLEAGLRSFDRTMPEEINRLVTDALADLLLTPSLDADQNLSNEGVSNSKVFRVGNIMIDTLFMFLPKAELSPILDDLKLRTGEFSLVTLHRPSNVDEKEGIQSIMNTLNEISKDIDIIFPMHPRTKENLRKFGINLSALNPRLQICEPLGYLDFQKLMSNSKFVITDSGGVQEETTALKIPCITLRENTERPITILEGSNVIAGKDMQKLLVYANQAIAGNWKQSRIPEMWDGKTAKRVIEVLEKNL